MKSLKQYLYESLLRHIALELKKQDIIYEKYGEYNGCEELIQYIINSLKKNNYNNLTISYDDVSDIDNIKFNILYILFYESNKNTADYLIPTEEDKDFLEENDLNPNYEEYSVIDSKTDRFKYCIIKIESHSFRNNSLDSLLEHELTHLFNDYKIQAIGLNSFFDIFSNDSYKRTKEYNKNRAPYRARELENALYLMNEYEKNAFISQLACQIRQLKKEDVYYKDDKIDANKIYLTIKELDIYKAYMRIGDFINDYDNNILTDREKNEIIVEWKIIYKEELNINQIFKKLKKKFINTKNKIESIIPKKIAEEYGLYRVSPDSGINILNPQLIL